MTFEEAKKLLKKEFTVILFREAAEPFEFDESRWFENEKPSVLEAFRVLAKEGYYTAISGHDYMEHEKRLNEEHKKNTKAPGPGEEQPEDKKGIIYPTTFPEADFYYKHVLNEGNPALKESASQFNDALLDEQAKEIESLRDKCKKYADILDSVGDKLRELKAENRRIKNSDLNLEGLAHATRELKEKDKKIVELTEENERLKDQVAVIYACKENNEKYNLKQIKRLGKEIAKLNGIIHDKNAVLADVAEELRLSKIREKNLTEVGQKYMNENEELRKKLADKVVDKIDANVLKSAESALAWKEKEIADLQEKLAATKNELDAFKESYKRRIKEDSEHFEHIQKICNAGLQKWLIESEYLEKDKPFRFSQLPELSEEEEKKLEHAKKNRVSSDHAEEGADLSGVIVLCGKDFIDALKKVKDVWQ